jgi:response regulator NasT
VRKLLDRAKGQLQDGRGMTEAQAFRWIQKTSMDRRQTMRAVAEEIVAEAEVAASESAQLPNADAQADPVPGKPGPAS